MIESTALGCWLWSVDVPKSCGASGPLHLALCPPSTYRITAGRPSARARAAYTSNCADRIESKATSTARRSYSSPRSQAASASASTYGDPMAPNDINALRRTYTLSSWANCRSNDSASGGRACACPRATAICHLASDCDELSARCARQAKSEEFLATNLTSTSISLSRAIAYKIRLVVASLHSLHGEDATNAVNAA